MYIDRYKYFRDTQLWPLSDNLNYEQWLANFCDDELEIAQRILDFFIYIPDSIINQMLSTVIGKCGYYFKRQRGAWTNNDYQNNCWYSFVPGEEQKPTDSGYVFNRKLRDKLEIPEKRIISFSDLLLILSQSTNQNVILVDDFVGSGHQTYVAWKLNKQDSNQTLEIISRTNNHKIVYAPLIVNHMGYNTISSDCKGLGLTFIHLLDTQYSLFDQNCLCWEGDINIYHKAVDLMLNKSKMLGIPFTNGRCVTDVRGYKEQGLALAFEHGMPDACPPIFYWETENWKPLIKKVYSRY